MNEQSFNTAVRVLDGTTATAADRMARAAAYVELAKAEAMNNLANALGHLSSYDRRFHVTIHGR